MTDSLHSKEIARSGTEPAANDELLPCPYPASVYLCHPHIQHSFNGQSVVINGLFTSIKPSGGAYYEYTRAQPYTHAQVMALVEEALLVIASVSDHPLNRLEGLKQKLTPFTQQKE